MFGERGGELTFLVLFARLLSCVLGFGLGNMECY